MEMSRLDQMAYIHTMSSMCDTIAECKGEPPKYNDELLQKIEACDPMYCIVKARTEAVRKVLAAERNMAEEDVFTVNPYNYLLISLMSGGVPGIGINMLYCLFKTAADRSPNKVIPIGHYINAEDFSYAFSKFYQCGENPEDDLFWEKQWDAQKTEKGKNQVDDYLCWKYLFSSSMKKEC